MRRLAENKRTRREPWRVIIARGNSVDEISSSRVLADDVSLREGDLHRHTKFVCSIDGLVVIRIIRDYNEEKNDDICVH